ncbi:MBL fold metallo-hydrolase [Membranihabitans maritimus]|uniref:MBL fold metallo-hydrolase n=1 Tax=Membranihabitans maritimus TaxID=2904244 RepID=UPI001F363EC2|nr:MBL fold metallo-hydrolase [Membranihabitans maritimus]
MSAVLLIIAAIFLYMQHPKFGKAPSKNHLEVLEKSPNFKEGTFQNIHSTPYITEGYSMIKIAYDFIFTQFPRTVPLDTIPSIKTDLKNLPVNEDVLVWFGHSSYFIQLNGIRFLIDPVFSGNASPIPRSNKSFTGTDIYTVDDMPTIDYLLISHDHYDHLDYETILKLKPKINRVVCGLGVGSHFEHWKFDSSKIIEKDWNEKVVIDNNITLHTATARHFSGRGFTRSNTLWLSFILQTPTFKMYLGGDSGYDTHFAELGKKFDGFDFAILENGQYNKAWQELHMLPEEVLKATLDLKAARLFPVHSSKFKLAFHPWDEPLELLSKHNKNKYHLPLVTPIIGEIIYLNNSKQIFTPWWKELN